MQWGRVELSTKEVELIFPTKEKWQWLYNLWSLSYLCVWGETPDNLMCILPIPQKSEFALLLIYPNSGSAWAEWVAFPPSPSNLQKSLLICPLRNSIYLGKYRTNSSWGWLLLMGGKLL